MVVLIDVPDPNRLGSGGPGGWVQVGEEFDSKAEAVAWIRANIGNCDDDGNICLLTELEEEEEEEEEEGDYQYDTVEECRESGDHLKVVDEDGYCNWCGE
jgi:hypothetical protein